MPGSDERVVVRVMCHNEEGTIVEVVVRLLKALDGRTVEVEVIDDGSTDRSPALVREMFADDARVTLFSHATNLGIGPVLRHAFRPTGASAVVLLCGDLQFAPEDVVPLLDALDDADLVIAQRRERDDALIRKAISEAEQLATRLLVGRSFRDVHWVRAVRGRYLAACNFATDSPMVDLELALSVADQGGRVRLLDLPHFRRRHGRGSGADPVRIARSLADLLRVALSSRGHAPHRYRLEK